MTTDSAGLDCLAGGGDTGALMRSIDWSTTGLGPVASWPRSLKTLVSAMLASRFAMRIMWGPQYHLLYNDEYVPVLGERKHPHAMGRPALESYPELWSVVGPMFDTAFAGESVALDDYQLPLNRHGYLEECYFTLSYSPVRDDDNAIAGVLGVVHETTEQVLVTRRLATLRELGAAASKAQTAEDACETAAQVMARNAADVPFALFYLADTPTTARLVARTGLPSGARAARESIDLSPDTSDRDWPLERVARGHGLVPVIDLQARFGEEIHAGPYPQPLVSVVVLPIARPGSDRPYGFFIAGVNPRRALDDKYEGFFELACEHVASAISNARAYEHERRRAQELAEIDRQKTAFFGNVSHEFRTPLALMLGPLADALASPEHALTGSNLVAAHRNALRLLKLVNTLLEFSRIEAGRVRANLELTDLPMLTREVASAFDSVGKKAGLQLVVDCEAQDEPTYVDREMWEKIVLNLLSNAFKFTFEGAIRVTLARVGDGFELAVADTGIGIAKDELPRLFERFHRVEGARSRTHEGSGIGLALVQELAKLHGGTVAVESEPGRGSVFRVSVPFRPAQLPNAKPHDVADRPSSSLGIAPFLAEASRWVDDGSDGREGLEIADVPTRTQGARVLVVDDNADMRGYVGRVLGRDFTVEVAPNGRAALAQIEARAPDLVLTDVTMPELDGLGLVRALRSNERTRTLPVILLSARAGEESRVDGLDAGADDYLTKPFSARELVARVRTHIELGRLRARIESERRVAAEAERARIHELFMQAPAAICVLHGPQHVFELANPPYIELVGGREVVGKALVEALPETAPVVLPILDRVYATGEPFYGSELLIPLARHGAVEETYFNFVYKPVLNRDGFVEGIAVVAHDVTDQVSSRKVSERLSQALAATNRELDQFAYVASHDLKAPLRGISNLSHWIEEGLAGKLDDETKEQMALMRGRVRRLEALIDGILTYSRAGRARDRIESFDVGALLAETRDLLAPPAEATIVIGPMPQVEAERVPMQQVFLNLMSNALKHAGRRDPRIEVACVDEGVFLHFLVTDDGPGIAPEYQERIWAIFTTLQARDKVEGTGIGLSVVKKIVETRGGRVALDSALGKGATFHVYWPKRPAF
jgi:signal transduction histidine kinase/CheY-like chemotaxis protein